MFRRADHCGKGPQLRCYHRRFCYKVTLLFPLPSSPPFHHPKSYLPFRFYYPSLFFAFLSLLISGGHFRIFSVDVKSINNATSSTDENESAQREIFLEDMRYFHLFHPASIHIHLSFYRSILLFFPLLVLIMYYNYE